MRCVLKISGNSSNNVAIKLCRISSSKHLLARLTCVRVEGKNAVSVTIHMGKHESFHQKLVATIFGHAQDCSFYTDNEYLYLYIPQLYYIYCLELLYGESFIPELLTTFTTTSYIKIELNTQYIQD